MTGSRGLCIDASALVEFLLDRPRGSAVAEVVAGVDSIVAPDLVNAEVLDAIRRAELTGQVSARRAAQAVVDLEDSPVERVATTSMAVAQHRGRPRGPYPARDWPGSAAAVVGTADLRTPLTRSGGPRRGRGRRPGWR